MATKKTKGTPAVITQPGTALTEKAKGALANVKPGSWRAVAKQMMTVQKETLDTIPTESGNFLSLRGGTISLGGVERDNPLEIIVLAYIPERVYYSKAYKADVLTAPDCYSFDQITNQKPHPDAEAPQSDACKNCKYNEFGSARESDGKGCKEGVRIAFLLAEDLKPVENVLSAPIIQMRLSVNNSKTWSKFAKKTFTEEQPSFVGVTMLNNKADSKSQYAVSFQFDAIEVPEIVLDALASRVQEADELMRKGYPDMKEKTKTSRTEAPKKKARKFG